MAITRQEKEVILKELVEKFQKAQSLAFGQYAGMTVEQLSKMRREMREQNVEFKVAKKTLIKLAAKEMGVEVPDESIEGTVGVAISYTDAVAGPKLIKSTSKKVEVLKLLGGVMDGRMLSQAEMQTLASLPSRDQLLATFMSMLQAPMRSFAGAIQAPGSSLARAFTAYGEKNGASA